MIFARRPHYIRIYIYILVDLDLLAAEILRRVVGLVSANRQRQPACRGQRAAILGAGTG
jgi:hypothetical protein